MLLTSLLMLLVISATFVVSSIPVVNQIALKHRKFDLPSSRKMHQRPIARLGGISICFGTLLALSAVWLFAGQSIVSADLFSKVIWVLLGSFAFFLIGLADDLVNLSPALRLAMQTSVAGLVWLADVQIDFITLPGIGLTHLGWLSLPVTILWLTGVVNAINWIDGLDGLASGVSCIAALSVAVVSLFTGQHTVALVMFALAGSLIGFLYHNFNPARIFMGDGGSYFIGFLLAGMSIVGLVKSAAVTAIALPFLILAVPIVDMVAVILARLKEGQSPMSADKRHLHHRLLKFGLPHRFTVIFIYTLALWTGSLAIALAGIPNGMFGVVGATILLGCSSWRAWSLAQQS
ncbi:MAG: undecaprenyl/decaprenyl-phosphate alpha-N-acetylglucosaminyl 1-phosphate transferase [Leptolyngbyaceae cyanobacterium SL_5_9]|nr:undecaprenyl/decaprenyl-phosphate alpha-N-acetylglucosaminyl 1-phosphate transferase [Leptolyngbyaceae cyanobacterium SL_5_9]NJO72532.1 undecaprenyl/decaprenyl-phosphate alpha-N-acetylglucosaminyl 1-phosphate transferase [Leptolyngbyaceae cyanobacterium RM1_406_9]